MAEALLDSRRVNQSDMTRLRREGIVAVNLSDFYKRRGASDPRMPVQQSFLALLGDF